MLIPLIHLPSPFLTDQKTLMPLGLLYLGASAEHHGHECAIIDLAGIQDFIPAALNALSLLPTPLNAVGIGITTSQAPLARELSTAIRAHFSKTRIVAGGPHVTHCLQAARRQPQRTAHLLSDLHSHYDCLVMGDAEKALFDAFLPAAPKVIDATLKLSSYYVDNSFLDTLPFPARHLIDVRSYHYNLGHSGISEQNAVNIMSQRGCPYACRFCASRMDKFGRALRKTSPYKVVSEIEHLYLSYGYTDFTFYDDELNVDSSLNSLLDALCDLQMRLGRAFRFRCFVKANLVTRSQLQKLAGAGFKVIATGAESGSQRILANMLKKATKEHNTRVVEWAKEFGILTKSIMSLGHPGESPETLQETEDWLDAVQLDDVNFTIVSPLPSSAYYDDACYDGRAWVYTAPETTDRLYDTGIDWTQTVHFYNADPSLDYAPTVSTDFLSSSDLSAWHAHFESKYKRAKLSADSSVYANL